MFADVLRGHWTLRRPRPDLHFLCELARDAGSVRPEAVQRNHDQAGSDPE